MAEEVHSLAVAIHPEGVDETNAELNSLSDTFDDTADDVGESAGLLAGFARKFRGAGLVFGAAFGTMIGAVASKMPIVSETFSALDAILTAVGLRLDKLSRDQINPLNRDLFDLAGAIARGEGEFSAWLDVLGRVEIMVGDRLPGPMGRFIELMGFATMNADELARAFASLPSRLAEGLAGVANVVNQELINPIIEGVNRAIAALNSLPGTDISTGPRRIPGTESPGFGRGGNEQGAFTPDPFDPGSPGTGGTESAFGFGTVETDVNVDGQKVGSAVKSFTVSGTLSRGRGFRMR